MTPRDALRWTLDRPGGRRILALIASRYAKRLNHAPTLRVFYDSTVDAWGRQTIDETVIDGHQFRYYADDLKMQSAMTPWSAATRRHWLTYFEPKPGDTILDIGAEVGSDVAAFAKSVGAGGTVIAVEAHPDTFRLLERTVEQCKLAQVKCVHAAITSVTGDVFIEDGPSSLSAALSARGTGHRVRGLSVDDLCKLHNVQRVALLKMNIEGSERDALRGMSETVKRTAHVCIACHDFRADRGDGEFFRTRDMVVSTLRAMGLEVAPPAANVPVYIRDHVHAWWPRSTGP